MSTEDFGSKYTVQYRMTWHITSFTHSYEVVGRWGGLCLHITDLKGLISGGPDHSAGLEIHSRQPFGYQKDDAPSQPECWLIKQPCWHDGNSLYAEEHWLPLHLSHKPDEVLAMLCREADERFAEFSGATETAEATA